MKITKVCWLSMPAEEKMNQTLDFKLSSYNIWKSSAALRRQSQNWLTTHYMSKHNFKSAQNWECCIYSSDERIILHYLGRMFVEMLHSVKKKTGSFKFLTIASRWIGGLQFSESCLRPLLTKTLKYLSTKWLEWKHPDKRT